MIACSFGHSSSEPNASDTSILDSASIGATGSCTLTSTEDASDGYVVFTFNKAKEARVKTAIFADVSEANLFDDLGCDDTEDGDAIAKAAESSQVPAGYASLCPTWRVKRLSPCPALSRLSGLPLSPAIACSRRGLYRHTCCGQPLHEPGWESLVSRRPRRMLRCRQCAKHYRNEYSLRHHICIRRKGVWRKGDVPSQLVNGQLVHFCPTCGKPFKWLGNLTRHYYVHTGQRFFKCDICLKEFFSAYQVRRHMNSHTGVRFNCTVCDKPFTCKYACSWHIRQHFRCVK